MLADDLGLHPRGPGPWKIHFAEYIRAAHRMHSPKWKLTNRDLFEGYLTVTEEELKRILEEADQGEGLERAAYALWTRRSASLSKNTWGRSRSSWRS